MLDTRLGAATVGVEGGAASDAVLAAAPGALLDAAPGAELDAAPGTASAAGNETRAHSQPRSKINMSKRTLGTFLFLWTNLNKIADGA